MRNISVAITEAAIAEQRKTVTRRIGWSFLEVGDLLQPVRKGMGLAKGEKMHRIGPPIRVAGIHREPLNNIDRLPSYGEMEVALEGFPEMTTEEFVAMFCEFNKCRETVEVNRIRFAYTFTADEHRKAAVMHRMNLPRHHRDADMLSWEHLSTAERDKWMSAVRHA